MGDCSGIPCTKFFATQLPNLKRQNFAHARFRKRPKYAGMMSLDVRDGLRQSVALQGFKKRTRPIHPRTFSTSLSQPKHMEFQTPKWQFSSIHLFQQVEQRTSTLQLGMFSWHCMFSINLPIQIRNCRWLKLFVIAAKGTQDARDPAPFAFKKFTTVS